MSDWVGIFIILISLFCGGFALGIKWGEPMLNSSKASPPAQPDVPDTNVKDMISRQAAIDAVDNYIGTFDAIDVNFLDGLKTAKKLMMQLPFADAVEVVRCKDCKSFSHGYCKFHDAKFVREDGYCYW